MATLESQNLPPSAPSKLQRKSRMVSFRMPEETYQKILKALNHPANSNTSVSDYCKQVVERHAFRHSTRKYRQKIFPA